MRFEVQFPDGVPHDVELQGSLAVVGRDPSCDLVLHDVKCSRRHAVLEAGPSGVVVRDTGSANGVYVNGQKVERAPIRAGDVLRLGDTVMKVLADDVPGTVVMAAGNGSLSGDAVRKEARRAAPTRSPLAPRGFLATPRDSPLAQSAAPPATSSPPAEAEPGPDAEPGPEDEAAPAAEPRPAAPSFPRPLTLSVLAALWLMSVPVYLLGGFALALSASGLGAAVWAVAGLGLAALSGAMAWGLWSLQPWTRIAQLIVAGLGVLVCPFTLASIVVLAYVLSPAGASSFARPATRDSAAARSPQETAFALALLVTVLLGGVVIMLALFLPQVASRLS